MPLEARRPWMITAPNADYEVVKESAALEERARAACAEKVISPAEEQRWLEHVASLRDRGQLWLAMMVFTVRGIKP